ncbi:MULTISPECIES: SDR family NAD(P)-dependent oxidoreductase [unclassified Burkholderia]|uniref:SDR family NAD(P)-dependent oxidoreductase n=1 Tax=unclassified Burkholderia TaxID=2613784 RepID=UPI000F55E539|nr:MULTISPECIES: SDR family oxidoreductase [unclassified Burkholderia]RQR32843.1 SDR family NAD(P)-dependent oxidoreductase [Burkholderia sp. Bp9131]RQR64808.1 SDR family NAD(P)-dependent oxidoreductase [Burkholderia sp. Bp9015]RQR74154.1 SDR family NAD(P)-dependent oxidoreductase [Burkholderia sp. Bp9011]RQR85967.1 SDR family NAD(P)-dependent oxidoreductase [Burkholderia sp. Bp9010]RQS66380.1 SDR family NAD(P)-dependent oxidoreductase [Burkholderia sp. Bp8977]
MNRLANKVAVITGGNSGIGYATARLFVEEGANVVIVGRRSEAVTAAVAELGNRATGLTGDLADLRTHERVATLVAERFGGADIYVANAGVNTIAPSSQVGVESYDEHFATNTRAVFFGVQKIAPHVRDGGAILLTSSIASSKVFDGHAVYAGTKAAIEAFARSWVLEFNTRGIRVNVISPGPTDTPILSKLGIESADRPAFEAAVSDSIPLGRFGRPEELARAALFLVSSEGSFVNGVNLNVDGGMSLR